MRKRPTILSMALYFMDSLVVQILLPKVQLTSAEVDLKITEQTGVEL